MSVLVGTLAVDVVNGRATFTLDDAKSELDSFGKKVQDTQGQVDYSMGEARHSVMMLGEEFGVHLPRGVTSFIASIGPLGAVLEAAFPFLAIILGATLLIEHLAKLREEGEKLAQSQSEFGTIINKVFMSLDDKLLEAGIRADELAGNHLAALSKQLTLIDHASLKDLMQQFDILDKAADAVFAQLKASWYQFGAGSAGAKHSLEEFKAQYDSLLSQGKDTEATALLDAKVQREEKILALQKQARDSQGGDGRRGNYQKYEEAIVQLRQLGVGITEKEIAAQQTLVDALDAQVAVQQKVVALKQAQDQAATQKTDHEIGGDDDKRWREEAREAKQAADDAEKAWEKAYQEAVSKLEESEKVKIAATREGSQERIAAIDAAIKEEESKGLQNNNYYKGLLVAKVQAQREMTDQIRAINQRMGEEDLKNTLAMAKLNEKATEDRTHFELAMRISSAKQVLAADIKAVQDQTNIDENGYRKQLDALDKFAKDYEVKKKELMDKIAQTEKQGGNQVMELQQKALLKQEQDIKQAYTKMADDIGNNIAKTLVENKNFAQAMEKTGEQMLEGMIKNLVKMILLHDEAKLSDAKKAAADAYAWAGNPILGGVLAAGAFAAVMAFEEGGVVPGMGSADNVPAMLSPHEMILPAPISTGLQNAIAGGNLGGDKGDIHVHHSPTYHVNTIDGRGFKGVLEAHKHEITQHVKKELRRSNK
jgi:hypothetical protein